MLPIRPDRNWITAMIVCLPQLAFAGSGLADVADSDPGLGLFMIALLAGFVAASILALMLTIIGFSFAGLLVVSGALAVSVTHAWYRGSITSGLRLFFRLTFILFGLVGGSAAGWILQEFWLSGPPRPEIVAVGGLSGAVAGFLMLRVMLLMLRRFAGRFASPAASGS